MRKFLLFVLCVFWSLPAFAQDTLWSRTYGGSADDVALSAQQTTDGGYIAVGWTSSFGAGDYDVYLVKTHANGGVFWSRTYGGSDHEEGWSVQQTTDGGYIVAGMTSSFGAGVHDIYLIKTDSTGDTLWTRTYGGSSIDYGYCVRQTTDGGYIVTGYTNSFGAGDYDVYLIKTDSTGDTLWTRTYGGSGDDCCWFAQQTTDQGYIVVARTGSFGAGSYDIYLVKTDSTGDTLWTRTYGGSDGDVGWSVCQTIDGDYIVTGYTESFGAGEGDAYLIKTDSTGDTLWTRTYGGSDYDLGWSVQQTSDGGYVVAGGTYSFGAGNSDVYVIRTDSTGDTLWARTYGGSDYDRAACVQKTTDEGYVVAGYTYSFGTGGRTSMLTKLDSLGNACIGEFVSSTVASVSCTITSPATVVGTPATIVTSPATEVTSPATEVTTVCLLLCGDANRDNIVDIGDVIYLIGYVYIGSSAPNPLCLGDANCDGVVDGGDVIYLINHLFLGTSAPCPDCCS